MIKKIRDKAISQYAFLAVIVLFLIFSYQLFDLDWIVDFLTNSHSTIQNGGVYIAFLILALRSFSIVVPIVPGTYCAVIAGYIYGIQSGLLLIFIADLFSCSTSFFISRRLGRGFVKKLLGSKQMQKIEKISNQYLENNFFLMTGLLMTSWFDFVCYGVGLTKLSFKRFLPALIISILISDLPFVAGGYTLSGLRDISLREILNGDVQVVKGPYLLILIVSALIIFALAFLNPVLKKVSNIGD